MAYKKGWAELPDVPHRCPVCDDGQRNPEAVRIHNQKAAYDGCRKYPPRRA